MAFKMKGFSGFKQKEDKKVTKNKKLALHDKKVTKPYELRRFDIDYLELNKRATKPYELRHDDRRVTKKK